MSTIIAGHFQLQTAAEDGVIAPGATDIEKPEGSIVAGDWLDIDPLSPLRRVPA